MNQLDLSYYSKKDLPNILVYIELILTVFLPSFRMKDYMTNYRNFDIPKLPVISYFSFSLSISVHRPNTGSFPIFFNHVKNIADIHPDTTLQIRFKNNISTHCFPIPVKSKTY